jgi:hypothetical protein
VLGLAVGACVDELGDRDHLAGVGLGEPVDGVAQAGVAGAVAGAAGAFRIGLHQGLLREAADFAQAASSASSKARRLASPVSGSVEERISSWPASASARSRSVASCTSVSAWVNCRLSAAIAKRRKRSAAEVMKASQATTSAPSSFASGCGCSSSQPASGSIAGTVKPRNTDGVTA